MFDNAVQTCAEAAFMNTGAVMDAANTDIYDGLKSLEGFCSDLGDIIATAYLSSAPITSSLSVSPVDPGSMTLSDNAGATSSPPSESSSSSFKPTILHSTTSKSIDETTHPTVDAASGHAGIKIVGDGEAIGISFVCALVLLFLC